MPVAKVLKWTGIVLGVLLGLLLVWSAIVIVFGIRIDLGPFRTPVEAAASQALGREVRIEGSAYLRPTAWPLIEVEGVSVANLEGWEPRDFALLDLARLELAFLPLLRGEISIGEITVEGLTLHLESSGEGQKNWQFHDTAPAPEEDLDESVPADPVPEEDTRIEFV